jgi:hypothetical protein
MRRKPIKDFIAGVSEIPQIASRRRAGKVQDQRPPDGATSKIPRCSTKLAFTTTRLAPHLRRVFNFLRGVDRMGGATRDTWVPRRSGDVCSQAWGRRKRRVQNDQRTTDHEEAELWRSMHTPADANLAAGAGIDRGTLGPAGSAVNLPIEQPRMPAA